MQKKTNNWYENKRKMHSPAHYVYISEQELEEYSNDFSFLGEHDLRDLIN